MIKPISENPFHSVYISDRMENSDDFCRLFSPAILAGNAMALFEVGNTVIMGTDGIGKSMLLKLLNWDIRKKYTEHSPNQKHLTELLRRHWVSIDVNLSISSLLQMGSRRLSSNDEENHHSWICAFADCFNYYGLQQLLQFLGSLTTDRPEPLHKCLSINVSNERLESFTELFKRNSCFFGYLESAKCYDDLIQLVNERVQSYRSFLNWNSNEIPRSILETKTSISIPLSQAVNCLRQSGIIADDVALFVAVDQIEFLKKIDWSKASTGERSLGSDFVKLLMTCLASRDTRVCYKVACRPYAFSKELLNTEAVLEVGRDYQMVNLDEILRAKENTNRKLYQNFVKDICLRRISYRGFSELADEKIFKEFLPGLNDEEEAARYGSGADAFSKSLDSNPLLSKKIKKQLSDHYKINPMQALLGLAWYLQKHAKNQEDLGSGWLNKSSAILKNTWSKERKEHALLLSASFNNQRKIYCGWTDIVSISGYSTMVFLYLMREIWDNWQRSSLVDWEKVEKYSDLRIDVRIQSAAIWTICAIYFDKIQEKPHGDKIKDFVERFALAVKDNMKQDSAMSYPGYTGFSLSMSDLETHREVLEFIKRCVQYGFLHEHDHTSKEEKVSRKKWYLAPILCVRFDIPLYTGKEPYYAKAYEIWKWMNGDFKIRLRKSSNDDQQSFLDL